MVKGCPRLFARMPRWSLLSGAPRAGDAVPPRGLPRAASAADALRRARRVAWLSSALFVWGAAGLLVLLLTGRVSGTTLAQVGILPAALGAAAVWVVHRRRPDVPGVLPAAGALGTLALVLAVAGHVLHPRGAMLAPLLPPQVGALAGLPAWAGVVLLLALLLFVPLYAGARLNAIRLGLEAGGRDARGPVRWTESLVRDEADALHEPAPWRRLAAGKLRRFGEGLLVPGLLALDVAGTLAHRARLLVQRRTHDRIRFDAELPALRETLAAAGAFPEGDGRGLVVGVPEGGEVRVERRRLVLPAPVAVLDVEGARDDVRAFRALLETTVPHAGAQCWGAAARRWERRLNGLTRDAEKASTLEERSVLLEEANRVAASLAQRETSEEDRAVLDLKDARLRLLLSTRLLSEPPGARPEERRPAPGPTLTPPLSSLMGAGGLAAARRLVFVPFWVLPVRTPWGEQEVAVSATTGRLDADESRALLEAMRRRAPVLLLEGHKGATFLPAPPPTAALLRSLRPMLRRGASVPEGALEAGRATETVFVPFLATEEGYVNALTGTKAPDLGNGPLSPKLS